MNVGDLRRAVAAVVGDADEPDTSCTSVGLAWVVGGEMGVCADSCQQRQFRCPNNGQISGICDIGLCSSPVWHFPDGSGF